MPPGLDELFKAAATGYPDRVQALLSQGMAPDQFDFRGHTPLIRAIRMTGEMPSRAANFEAVIQQLLATGVLRDLRSADDLTPLMHAAQCGNTAACAALLAAGAEPNERNLKGRTALMEAACHLNESVLALLLARGANVALDDNDGRTALDVLPLQQVDKPRLEFCRTLLRHAAGLAGTLRETGDWQPGPDDLFKAAATGHPDRVQWLLSQGIAPHRFDSWGHTPLIRAILVMAEMPSRAANFEAVIQRLLATGVLRDLRSFDDLTPLMHAAQCGNTAACAALLAAGAEPNERNFKGRTALMEAAYHLHEPVLALLLANGANVALEDNDGDTALDIVQLRKKDKPRIERCRTLLQRSGTPRSASKLTVRTWLPSHFTASELVQTRNPPHRSMRFVIAASVTSLGSVALLRDGWGAWGAWVGAALCASGLLAGRNWLLPTPDALWRELIPVVLKFTAALAVAALALSLLLGSGGGAPLAALLGIPLLLYAFPSIVQLPYLALARAPKPVAVEGTTPGSEPRLEGDVAGLEAVSNFMRLGWGALAARIRERRERLMHTHSHLASIGLALAIVATALGAAWLGPSGGLAGLLPFAATAVALAVEGRLRSGRLARYQSWCDHVAADINAALENGERRPASEAEPFILYLRTFGITGKLDIGGVDFETAFAYNLSPMLPMIALGHPGEAVGAGRILTSEAHWKEEILRLVASASQIMLIPSHRDGTQWEIGQLKSGQHLDKTIFAMPPDMPFDAGRYATAWNRAASALGALGLHLPQHFRDGLLFKLGADGEILAHAPLGAAPFMAEMELLLNAARADSASNAEDGSEDSGADDDADSDDAEGDDGDADGDGGHVGRGDAGDAGEGAAHAAEGGGSGAGSDAAPSGPAP